MGATLKRLRIAAGKTPTEVAADLGFSERHLYRLESGKTPLTRRWCLVFSTYYAVPVEEIEGCDEAVEA